MNKLYTFTTKKYLIVAGLAILLSLATIRWHTQESVPFCVNSAGCKASETLRGNVKTTSYGFPATYRQVAVFNPDNTNPSSGGYPGYNQAELELQSFSILAVIVNTVFWFALLQLLARLVRQRRPAEPGDITQEPEPLPDASNPITQTRKN